MKPTKLFMIFSTALFFSFYGCSETTDPETPSNEEIILTMSEADQLIGRLIDTDGYTAIEQMPEMVFGGFEMYQKLQESYSKFLSGRSTASITETNPMVVFMYLFLPRGTYTYDGIHWSYDEQPDDEIVLIFPYNDPETDAPHSGILRYYNMAWTETLITVSVDIIVDNEQAMEVDLEVTGTGLLGISGQTEITSISMSCFVFDNENVQYDFSATVNQTQVVMSLGITGEIPLVITMTGDLFEEDSEGPESLVITYSSLTIYFDHLDVENGDVGYITWEGIQVATIIAINGELYLVWNDGTQTPLISLLPNSISIGGEFY